MAEKGGPTAQSGILYQNSIAALYAGRLLDPRFQAAAERVIELRVEAPEDVDDVVVRHADHGRTFIQAKEALTVGSEPWSKLWRAFAAQAAKVAGQRFRLVLAVGTSSQDMLDLRQVCERAQGKRDDGEWRDSLSTALAGLADKVVAALPDGTAAVELLRHVEVWTISLSQIEREEPVRWMPPASTPAEALFRALRDKMGGAARVRASFRTVELLERLRDENQITIADAPNWGADVYRQAIGSALGTLEVPGTGHSAPIEELFVWLPLHDRAAESRHRDFEEEDPRWRWDGRGEIALEDFPRGKLRRAVIDAGAGFGKSTLLNALACRLSRDPVLLPVIVPLDRLAETRTVLRFLNTVVNTGYSVGIDWERLCETGRAVVLLDGLDELSDTGRTNALKALKEFGGRYPNAAFLLTVRDGAALNAPLGVPILGLPRLDDEAIEAFAEAYGRAGAQVQPETLRRHLHRHPDLARLLRIPLFLALVLTTLRPEDDLPTSRAELLERYLQLLLEPQRHKSLAEPPQPLDGLRDAAELIAWKGLEGDAIGLLERDAERILRAAGHVPAQAFIERMLRTGLLRRSGPRLRFTYPILQEYLAACWMVAHAPDQVGPSFRRVARRPWAQALQFALEMHPDAEAIIRDQLAQPDDAFHTTLRLIARCIVNGARVSRELRAEVGDRLAEAWPSEAFSIQHSIGILIADGFTDPLPVQAREHLIGEWSLYAGGGEIVATKRDPELTAAVLQGLMCQEINPLWAIEHAINEIAETASKILVQRVRRSDVSAKEAAELAFWLERLPASARPAVGWQQIGTDASLPPPIRMVGYQRSGALGEQEALRYAHEFFRWARSAIPAETYGIRTATYHWLWTIVGATDEFASQIAPEIRGAEEAMVATETLLQSDLPEPAIQETLHHAVAHQEPSSDEAFIFWLGLLLADDMDAACVVEQRIDFQREAACVWAENIHYYPEQHVHAVFDKFLQQKFCRQSLRFLDRASLGSIYRNEWPSLFGWGADEYLPHPSSERIQDIFVMAADAAHPLEAVRIRMEFGKADPSTLVEKVISFIDSLSGAVDEYTDHILNESLQAIERAGLRVDDHRMLKLVDLSNRFLVIEIIDMLGRQSDETIIPALLDHYHSRKPDDFVRERIFSALETLSSRYGKRIVRDGDRLRVESY